MYTNGGGYIIRHDKNKVKSLSITEKESFFGLLDRAIKPPDPSKERKVGSRTSGDYNGKRTRQRKAEDAED